METVTPDNGAAKNKEGSSEAPAPAQRPPADSKKDDPPVKNAKKKELQDSDLPAPLANGACKIILEELPEDSRVALESCLQFWRVISKDHLLLSSALRVSVQVPTHNM
eukprot:3935620-Rhodomonas_salina.2